MGKNLGNYFHQPPPLMFVLSYKGQCTVDEIEELWKDQSTKEKFNGMARRLKKEIQEKGSATLVIDWKSEARYEAVANRFASAKATEEWLNQQASDDDDIDDMRLFEDMLVNDHF
eukprot:gene1595-1761_t